MTRTSRSAGDWRRDIDDGVRRAGAALLLVTGSYLASRFIMEEELPALVAHGVRLVPVLVGDCLWDQEPLLAAVQWAHDPGRDGPLAAADPREVDGRIVRACRSCWRSRRLPGRRPGPPGRFRLGCRLSGDGPGAGPGRAAARGAGAAGRIPGACRAGRPARGAAGGPGRSG